MQLAILDFRARSWNGGWECGERHEMKKLVFNNSPRPTLGIELELALVDVRTMALSSSIERVCEKVPEKFRGTIKPELMQCYLEINTGICNTVDEAEQDLQEKLRALEGITDSLGLALYWTGTHPFSLWRDQVPTVSERYSMLLDLLQDMGRQLVTFGLHVHVGVDSGGKAIMICDRIMRHLPTLLAASCNSPWWENRVTGLKSHRSKIMEGLPTAGLPTLMRNWSEYVWLVNHLIDTGFINSIREIWWDVRPHHNFGTVEVRVCDTPGSLADAMGLAALIQCLVTRLSEEIDQGTYQHDCHPMMIRQNKWRAARYGLDAALVDSFTYAQLSARGELRRLVDLLRPTALELRCTRQLEHADQMAQGPNWSDRQLELLELTRDKSEAVRRMVLNSRLS